MHLAYDGGAMRASASGRTRDVPRYVSANGSVVETNLRENESHSTTSGQVADDTSRL